MYRLRAVAAAVLAISAFVITGCGLSHETANSAGAGGGGGAGGGTGPSSAPQAAVRLYVFQDNPSLGADGHGDFDFAPAANGTAGDASAGLTCEFNKDATVKMTVAPAVGCKAKVYIDGQPTTYEQVVTIDLHMTSDHTIYLLFILKSSAG